MSFSQAQRLFEAYELNDKDWWRRFRLIAYETWRKGSKNAPDMDAYFPLDKEEQPEKSKDELDEVWQKYGKLDKKKKRFKLFKKNVRAKAHGKIRSG